jgi:uncharacterized protein (TIGR01370 family)
MIGNLRWLAFAVAMALPTMGAFSPSCARAESFSPWAVYYADALPAARFREFNLIVFDSDKHPPLEPLVDRGKRVLGYLSLGELNRQRSYFDEVKAEGLLLMENPNWPGSFFVDVRDPRWAKRLVEEVIPAILRRGFHGLFFDTLDNPPHLERTDGKKFAGMTAAATGLVRAIRRHYPHITIMMNRGYDILEGVESSIDMVLGESVLARYDFAEKRYVQVPDQEYRLQVGWLTEAKRRRPALQVFTLDYWDPDDSNGLRQIYTEQRANGFIPYVATIALDRLISEPKP